MYINHYLTKVVKYGVVRVMNDRGDPVGESIEIRLIDGV